MELYLPQLIKSGVLLALLLVIRWILSRMIVRFAKDSERLEQRTGLILKHISFVTFLLLVIGLTLIWGVEIKDLGIVMSSVFAVIGIGFFAQWSILSNITSGVIMFFTFPYKIGDYIIVHDKEFPHEGVIEDIKTFHIVLRTRNNDYITYPNSLMLQKGVSVVKPDQFDDMIMEEEQVDKNVKEQPID